MNWTQSSSFLMAVGLFTMVLGLPGAVAKADVSHREALDFEDVEIIQRIHDNFEKDNYDAVTPALDLLDPVVRHLNQKYPVNGSPRSIGDAIKSAVQSGNDDQLRRSVMTFLVLNMHDVMTIARDANESGDQDTARVYTNKAMMTFKTTIEPRVQNPGSVKGALRNMNVALQEFNKYLGDPDNFNSSYSKGQTALKNLFPELGLSVSRGD